MTAVRGHGGAALQGDAPRDDLDGTAASSAGDLTLCAERILVVPAETASASEDEAARELWRPVHATPDSARIPAATVRVWLRILARAAVASAAAASASIATAGDPPSTASRVCRDRVSAHRLGALALLAKTITWSSAFRQSPAVSESRDIN